MDFISQNMTCLRELAVSTNLIVLSFAGNQSDYWCYTVCRFHLMMIKIIHRVFSWVHFLLDSYILSLVHDTKDIGDLWSKVIYQNSFKKL